MNTRTTPAPPPVILPLPLEGTATQVAWAFDERTRDLEDAYQRHRADFTAELERDTLARPYDVASQLTIAEQFDRRRGERGPKRRKLPTPEQLLATMPRGRLFRGRCRRRGRDFTGAPDLEPAELARDVLYALKHRGREEGGSAWDYQRIHELTLARAGTFDWFTAAGFMSGLTPGCPRALQDHLGRSAYRQKFVAHLIFADKLGRWGCYLSGQEWAALLGCDREYFYTLTSQLERAGYIIVIGTHRPREHHRGTAPSETACNWIGIGPRLAVWRDLWAQTDLSDAAAAHRVQLTRDAIRRHAYRQQPRRCLTKPTRRQFRDELAIAAERAKELQKVDQSRELIADAVERVDLATILDDLETNRAQINRAAADLNISATALLSPIVSAAAAPVPAVYLDLDPDVDPEPEQPDQQPDEPQNTPAIDAGQTSTYRGQPRRRRREPDLRTPAKPTPIAVLRTDPRRPPSGIPHAPTIQGSDTDPSAAGYEAPYPQGRPPGEGPAVPTRRPPLTPAAAAGSDPGNAGHSSRPTSSASPRLEGAIREDRRPNRRDRFAGAPPRPGARGILAALPAEAAAWWVAGLALGQQTALEGLDQELGAEGLDQELGAEGTRGRAFAELRRALAKLSPDAQAKLGALRRLLA